MLTIKGLCAKSKSIMQSQKLFFKINKKIIFGIILILIAGACFFIAIYYIDQPSPSPLEQVVQASIEEKVPTPSPAIGPKVEIKKESSVIAPPKEVKETKKKQEEKVFVYTPAPESSPGINMDTLVDEAKKIYSDEEKNRKEGALWVDRKTGKYIITLGAINNLKVGDFLRAYDGKLEIGQVKVEFAMDTISYVKPVNSEMVFLANNYYRVVMK
jgi:hypothetical protein